MAAHPEVANFFSLHYAIKGTQYKDSLGNENDNTFDGYLC